MEETLSKTSPATVIRAESRKQRVPQTVLAANSELSWPQWQRRMRGDVDWRLDELRAVALVLDIPLSRLTGEEG